MKIFFIILFFLLTRICALSQTVTLAGKNLPLTMVFTQIEKQTGYVVVFGPKLFKKAKPVSINVKNHPLKDFLQIVLKDQPFDFIIENKTISIKEKQASSSTDNISPGINIINIKGRVVNDKGDPVIASVTIKGADLATGTNSAGEFSLEDVNENASLIISGVSIETVEVKVSGKNDLLVKAITKVNAQQEVTVVSNGYQKISKERFVGSFSQLDSASYARRAGMDIIGRLDGTVTGLLFDKKALGGQLDNIQVRGLSTIQLTGLRQSASRELLVIVDNFPYRQDISQINPNDILTIDVLKDAAATSIWGAQAGNGVIVITTKKGKYNQAMQLSVNSNVTVKEKPNLYYYPQIPVPDYVDAEIFLYKNGAFNSDISSKSYPALSPVVEILDQVKKGNLNSIDSTIQIDALKKMDLRQDLEKYVYRKSLVQQHYISLNGGNSLFNYNFSGGYNRDLNNMQNSPADDQFTLSSTAGFRPVKKLEVTTGINYTLSTQRNATFSLGGDKITPYTQLANEVGDPLPVLRDKRFSYLDTVGRGQLLDWRDYPLKEPALVDRKDIARSITLNTGVSYRINSWLTAMASYQYINQTTATNNFTSVETYYTRNLINQFTNLRETAPDKRNPIPIGGILNLSRIQSISINARGQLNFSKAWNTRHLLNAMVAGEVSNTKTDGDFNSFYGYNKETGSYKSSIDYLTMYPRYDGGEAQIPNQGRLLQWKDTRFVSFLGNISYTFNNRYTFYASARKDGANMFGVNTNRRWKPLWSLAGSWDISKENFYNVRWMPSLRVRASYGYTGNPGNATGVPTISHLPFNKDITNLPQSYINDAPNPDLRWEKVRIINLATEFTLFKNRLSGSIDVYTKRATDIISLALFPVSTGVATFISNTASLKGSGFELTLRSRNIAVGSFDWQTNFGLSHATTIITKLYLKPTEAQYFVEYGLNASEGQMAYGLASYRWGGLDPLNGDPQGFIGKSASKDYKAIKSDSINNQVFHGSSIPLYSGFIGNTFNWKNFSLSANITYRFDFYFRRPVMNYSDLLSGQGHAEYVDRWQKTGDEKFTTVPSFTYPLNSDRDRFYQYAEINVLRGDNIRLQDIRLQYNITNQSLKKTPFKSVQVFVYANNLNIILWRKNKSGLDPDFVGAGSFQAPTPKVLTGGFSINL